MGGNGSRERKPGEEPAGGCCFWGESPRPRAECVVKQTFSATGDSYNPCEGEDDAGTPLDVEGQGLKGGLSAKARSKNVVHTEDEIRVERQSPEEQIAEQKAEALFSRLTEDWDDEAMSNLTQEMGKAFSLSKERVKMVLQFTQDKRLNCAQLNELIKMVSLEAHKEQVIFERYPHLTDRKNFETDVVNAFTLSTSIRGSLMRKLTKFLTTMSIEPVEVRQPDVKKEVSSSSDVKKATSSSDVNKATSSSDVKKETSSSSNVKKEISSTSNDDEAENNNATVSLGEQTM